MRREKREGNLSIAWPAPPEATNVVQFNTHKTDLACVSCSAVKLPGETSKDHGIRKSFSACWCNRRIQLKPFKEPLPKLRSLSDRSSTIQAVLGEHNGRLSAASENGWQRSDIQGTWTKVLEEDEPNNDVCIKQHTFV